MIALAQKKILTILDELPEGKKILDVGGSSAPFKRATHMIDIVPYEGVNWSQAKGLREGKVSKEKYTQFDICSRAEWPYQDKEFDYSICSHVLEDIRDPLWVCSELIRTSKAGYIEIPSRMYETTFDIEIANMAGASHHRWVIDLHDKKIRFTMKFMHIHCKAVNKNRGTYSKEDDNMYLRLEWSDSFEYVENFLDSGKLVFEYFLDQKIDEKKKWQLYRKIEPKNIIIRWLKYIKRIKFDKK
ncbi:MAG: hypothetical protein V4686_03065 [Patescibacteria group bacterium]